MKIVQLVPDCPWGDFEPSLLEKGVGGRETCALQISRMLATAGHEVINFAQREKPLHIDHFSDGPLSQGKESFIPVEMAVDYLRLFPVDGIISVEAPLLFADEQLLETQAAAKKLTHYQVAHIDDRSAPMLEAVHTTWGCLSPWHERFLRSQGAEGEFVILPNGVDIGRFPSEKPEPRDDGPHFFYSSSPDRGLDRLLRAWPYVLEMVPGAKLHVAYGAERFVGTSRWSHNGECDSALDVEEGLRLDGVLYHGKMGQAELAELMMACDMCLYPCDPQSPTETGCITLVEAAAAQAPAVTTDADCLGEEFADVHDIVPMPFTDNEYAEEVARMWFDKPQRDRLAAKGREFAEGRDWTVIGEKWIEWFEGS